ncbi:EAL domain-containing protein [Paenibacillus nasutitermitis]|uniref:PAS domain S-box-containing protein/diguanylate cyclase (GGDEF) domain-containing protein n=1 Tax=Paenibacillus nasutitermitis TaxID=1652958 RepID=A0A917DS56_9BACL|nr:EAL domain-containing protein [Paenibacillus nasutitermitis]GGD65871.1 hypothetical protein GCM10010911_24560 [Paenibacillus nasutitermitis]
MFFLMLVFSIVPLGLGLAIQTLFGRTMLSKSLFIFMLFIGVWQLDVAILFAHNYFSLGWIDFLFRLFRFGSIMLPPSLLYVTYAIYRSLAQKGELSPRWTWIINKKMIIALSCWSMLVYATGWMKMSIKKLALVESKHYASFLFPEYGSFRWIFNLSFPLFFICIGLCFFISLKVANPHRRAFLVLFSSTSVVAYSVGTLNMSQRSGLYPSSIAVLIFAIAVFIGFCFMHANVVREMNRALMNQQEFLRTVIDTNPSFIYTKNAKGALTLANLSLAKMYGETVANIVGKKETDFIQYEDEYRHGEEEELELLKKGEGIYNLEQVIVDHKGSRRWVQTAKIPIGLSDSRQLLCVSTDITVRKEYEQRIVELAYRDTLTGLPNRRAFNQTLNNALLLEQSGIVLMFIDLDRFKIINDTLGHSAGDQFLMMVAQRLSDVLESDGKAFRIGGDEFVIMLTGSSHAQAELVAEKILQAFKSPFVLKGQEVHSTTSIGMSLSSPENLDAESLMKHADTAMHQAKEQGRNKYRFYNSEMDRTYLRKMVLEKELRKAINHEELMVYYQPQIDLVSRKLVGVEALLRWNHPELGDVSPVEFIPLAEETGLIVGLGEWVLREACKQLKQWQLCGFSPIRVAVNISLRQFYESNLVESIARIVNETGIPFQHLDLEITESVAMHDTSHVIDKLDQLKRLGLSISMDDFGTGYSSLSYLKKLPIDKLKIDRSFLVDVTNDKDNAAIVTTIIAMAKNLDLRVVAEGVENDQQLQLIIEEGCHEAQGYLFGRPMPEQEIRKQLTK